MKQHIMLEQPSTSYKRDNSLEVLRGGICVAWKEPINIHYDGSENTEEQSKAKDDNVSNRCAERWDTTKVRFLTAILVKGRRAWIDGTIEWHDAYGCGRVTTCEGWYCLWNRTLQSMVIDQCCDWCLSKLIYELWWWTSDDWRTVIITIKLLFFRREPRAITVVKPRMHVSGQMEDSKIKKWCEMWVTHTGIEQKRRVLFVLIPT